MLNRRNSMSLHQPIMPFKWRPFDLYNDIHINRASNDDNAAVGTVLVTSDASKAGTAALASASAAMSASVSGSGTVFATCAPNCVRCQSNCDHLMLWGNYRKYRQSSRGSSSGSSCASLSTTSHFIPDIDSTSSINTAISNGSFEYYRKLLGQCNANTNANDKFSNHHSHHYQHNHHQQRTTGSNKCNGATSNCCFDSNYRNITRNRASIYNDNNMNKPCPNTDHTQNVPIQCTEQMQNSCHTQPQQQHNSPNVVDSPLKNHTNPSSHSTATATSTATAIISSIECHKRASNSGYFDNWKFGDNSSAAQFSRSLADSKY